MLVTGAPRSGTTFVGGVLATAAGVRFVYEPFNAQIGLTGIPQQFTYVAVGSRWEPVVAPLVEDLLHGRPRFHPSTIDAPVSGPKKLLRATLGSRTQVHHRVDVLRGGDRWLLKDPMAALSAEWLHRRFGAPTVVTVRHPAAVVHSYLRLGWTFGLEDLAAQPDLVEAFDLAELVGRGGGYERVESAARLWAALYTVLGTVTDRNDGVLAVRHEDVSAQPDRWFAKLHAHVGLVYDLRAQRHVQATTGTHKPAAPTDDAVHTLRRDSRADLGRWRRDLEPADAATIRRITEPVAAGWYADDDW
ncbi:sulfotransferase [Jatrophihabitans sp. YIM 134969]